MVWALGDPPCLAWDYEGRLSIGKGGGADVEPQRGKGKQQPVQDTSTYCAYVAEDTHWWSGRSARCLSF